MTADEALKNCPFCNSTELEPPTETSGVECWNCGASAGSADDWNRRELAAPGERCDALMDSQYLAGLKKGWNLGVADDQAGYEAVVKSREGYLAGLPKPPVKP